MERLGFTRMGNKQGCPLAIIHGWGCDSTFLLPIAQMFPERDIYLIDLPGYGKSRHLASIADDFSKTNYLLLNTIPLGSDVISWSFGTLYALRAISTVNNPCLNFDVFEKNMLFSCNLTKEQLEQQALYQTDSFDHLSVAEAAKLAHEDFGQPNTKLPPNGRTIYDHPLINSLVTICGSPRFPSDPNWKGMSAVKILKCNTKLTPRRLNMVLNIFFRLVETKKRPNTPSAAEASDAAITRATAAAQRTATSALEPAQAPATAATVSTAASATAAATASAATAEPNAKPAKAATAPSQATGDKASTSVQSKYEGCMCSCNGGKEIPYEVLMAGIRLVTFIDERPAMHHINIPTLHLFGALDPLVPASLSEYFDNPPLHRSYIFANSSHNPVQSEPEEFFKVVSQFYKTLH